MQTNSVSTPVLGAVPVPVARRRRQLKPLEPISSRMQSMLGIGFFVLFVLAFVAHMAAIAIKPNRPLVRSIFTGHVRLDYARSRHPLWIEEMHLEQPAQGDLQNKEGEEAQQSSSAREEDREAGGDEAGERAPDDTG